MKAKHLIQHTYWTRFWHVDREAVLRSWSRCDVEGRNLAWSYVTTRPAIFVRGDMAALLTVQKVWAETVQALWEGVVWKRC